MAIDETVSYTITKRRTRVTSFQVTSPFGGEIALRVNYEARKMLNDGSTYAIESAGEISRGPLAMNDTQTLGGNNVTLQQWLQLGEKFFDSWYVLDHQPKFLAIDLVVSSPSMATPAIG